MARTGMMERLLEARKKFSDLVLAVMPHRRILLTTAGYRRIPTEPTEPTETIEPTETTELMIMLMDLPHDILLDVLTKLPLSTLCWIRGVSMTLLNIIDNPSFATLYAPRLLNSAATYPAAVGSTSTNFASFRLLHVVPSGETSSCSLTTLQLVKYDVGKCSLRRSRACNARIFSSSRWYGCDVEFVFCNLIFIVLYGPRPYQWYLVNPLRGECLELPIIHDNVQGDHRYWFGMGFDNTTSTHKIVCISESNTLMAYVYTLEGARSSSLTSWRQIQSVPPCKLSTDNVSAYGDMHWLACDGGKYRIVSFDFKKDEFFLTPAPKSVHGYFHVECLLNFKGCLALVSAQSSTLQLWVLKDYENNEWELVCQIPLKLFSGIPGFQMSLVACGEWEHGIFFKNSGCQTFHFWDARDNSMIFLEPSVANLSSPNRQLWTEGGGPLPISFFSYTHSPISLKNYGNLVEREVSKSAVCDRDAETSTWYFE